MCRFVKLTDSFHSQPTRQDLHNRYRLREAAWAGDRSSVRERGTRGGGAEERVSRWRVSGEAGVHG